MHLHHDKKEGKELSLTSYSAHLKLSNPILAMKQKDNVIIIGAGLSGLTLAYLLAKENKSFTILEASNRVGGRIHTIKGEAGTPLELGATWLSDSHSTLIHFLNELNLKKYPQFTGGKSLFQTELSEPPQEFHVPEGENPSYRIAGGTQQIIENLVEHVGISAIKLQSKVSAITITEDEVEVVTNQEETYHAGKVALCLPPQLVGSQITFAPSLPDSVSALLPTVHTWMEGSIKFVLEYAEAFWRQKRYSGMLYSHVGIISEMYDHTTIEEDKFGFTGFLNGGAAAYSQEERRIFVLKQLASLIGPEAKNPLSYSDKLWNDEFVSNGGSSSLVPHQNNGHLIFHESYFNERLFFSGTETSSEFPGYMEGAIIAANNTFGQIINAN